ncbi:hypothetical protein ONE63_010326 [Megalurothrips usitatus]|uniref:DNA (cytosine-5-)-methyltransferase n=1 Tax=Megalurothrips usitatus TaxID=439358 RepID=A0AAV7XPF1_9NEOP|nr:hypothetical protein ONE63_010326 [Megalurothrips usitatus]
MKWHQASERLIECTPLVSSTCVSVPLVGNGNTFVFKVGTQFSTGNFSCKCSDRGNICFQVHPVPLRAIRVLSLFDGIGSAYQILQNSLGLKIDTYFSCEIDSDAIQVLKHTYHGRIVLLGCVKKLNAPLLHALGRVDLVLGGSPCNNLSRVNPRRLGLHEPGSSGGLFFEYVRIRDILSDLAMRRGDPFFWFYEQTAHLDAGVCDTMSRCLGSEPVRCCSSSVVPMRRIRNFWSNVPRLSETAGELAGGRASRLQDFLMPFRQANVRCLPTLTTNSSSEHGRGRELPVLEGGSQCSLSVTEWEQLFGFPPHYTDCANLSVSRRRRLLGRAWCIPLVSKLLHPIAEMFEKDLPCHNFL